MAMNVPASPVAANNFSTGMKVSCTGTTMRPTITMKNRSRPGNFIHAKA
jgi:hypothetical protein